MITKNEATSIFNTTVDNRRAEYEKNTLDFCEGYLTNEIKSRAERGYRNFSFYLEAVESIIGKSEVYDVKCTSSGASRISISKLKEILVSSGYDFCPSHCSYFITINW